nr:putative ribonuclease H-like domain-containing protein [Tanacetum cinerariifolium]
MGTRRFDCFSWLIQNIEPALTCNLTEYPTAKMLWDTLVVTYISKRDKLQIFILYVKANDIKQNNSSLEDFWISLQGEILRLEPLPSAKAEYITVCKEAAYQNILGATINETQGIAAGLIATETEGLGLVSKVNRRSDRSQIGSSSRVDKSKLKWHQELLKKGKASIAGSTKEKADTTDQKNLTRFEGMAKASVYSEKDDGLFSMNTGIGDIRTGAIIGRGTEIKGLYYVDEVTQNGAVMLSHGTGERKAWLWVDSPFSLIHSDGESESIDTLNWLRYVACGDGRSHSTADESHLSTQPEDHINVTQTAPNLIPERGNLITCLIIYVDDMIVTGDDKEEITKLKKYLFTEFEMKDLGRLNYFLGIEVLRSKQGIFMCQKRYILDLLAETGMIDCKPADTSMIVNHKLYMEEKAELADKGRYQQMGIRATEDPHQATLP